MSNKLQPTLESSMSSISLQDSHSPPGSDGPSMSEKKVYVPPHMRHVKSNNVQKNTAKAVENPFDRIANREFSEGRGSSDRSRSQSKK
jgi:hypothetical protein